MSCPVHVPYFLEKMGKYLRRDEFLLYWEKTFLLKERHTILNFLSDVGLLHLGLLHAFKSVKTCCIRRFQAKLIISDGWFGKKGDGKKPANEWAVSKLAKLVSYYVTLATLSELITSADVVVTWLKVTDFHCLAYRLARSWEIHEVICVVVRL